MTEPAGTAPPSTVVVVGGGIAGLAAALSLTRAGCQVTVLEQAPSFGEVGAGLQLAPNATRVLHKWGLLDDVIARGVLPRRLVMRDAVDGSELTHLDLQAVRDRYGAPYVVTHRTDLHGVLLAACRRAGVDLATGVRVEGTEVHPRYVEVIAEGRRYRAEVVLAADGLGSPLRATLSPDHPVDSGYMAYRGTVAMSALTDPSTISPDDVVVYVGPRCHLVQYTLRRGEVLNQVAVVQRDRSAPAAGAEVDAAFAGMCAAARANLAHLWRDRWWPMQDREPLDTWIGHRFALLGDAAHPMLQYLAQGACQAIEDADCLATAAAGAAQGEPLGWDGILTGYDRARTARAARIQRAARVWGDLWHSDGLLRETRNALLTSRCPDDFRYVDWLYGPAGGGLDARG